MKISTLFLLLLAVGCARVSTRTPMPPPLPNFTTRTITNLEPRAPLSAGISAPATAVMPVPVTLTNTPLGQALVLSITNSTHTVRYRVDTSIDLTEWQLLAAFDDGDPYVIIYDYAYTVRPYFFYRLRPE